jgi:hypothetical protein
VILNIVDNRKYAYRWKSVDVVAEPTWHDNRCEDSDQADRCENETEYEAKEGLSVSDAISWAAGLPYDVTLYLYDAGTHAADVDPASGVKLPHLR